MYQLMEAIWRLGVGQVLLGALLMLLGAEM